jgi:Uma2 family endonuclease
MSTTAAVTADQLLNMPRDGYRYELVAGELRKMSPAGWRHGTIGGRLHARLGRHVEERDLGEVFSAETGFLLARNPDTVRAPDVAFLKKARFAGPLPEDAFWPGAPDLAVEVVSPNDTMRDIDDKVKAWLDGGTAIVWVVNPKWHVVTVYRSATNIKTLSENDELSGEEVIPDFRCALRELFAGL